MVKNAVQEQCTKPFHHSYRAHSVPLSQRVCLSGAHVSHTPGVAEATFCDGEEKKLFHLLTPVFVLKEKRDARRRRTLSQGVLFAESV